jgi:hypothetical protein
MTLEVKRQLFWFRNMLPSSSMVLNTDIKTEEPALESISWFNIDMNFCENIIMIIFFLFLSILWCNSNGIYPQEDLPKFGYKG